MKMPTVLWLWIPILAFQASAWVCAGEPDPLDVAIHRGVTLLQKGVQNYPNNRKCFSCHHQALPLFAISLAERDRRVKQADTKDLIDTFTHESFVHKNESMEKGEGVGGGALTVGYGLWALDLANHDSDETTNAMVSYLHRTQEPNGSWEYESHRPPAASSIAMTTALGIYGLKAYGPAVLDETQMADSLMKSALWYLTECQPKNHEDLIGEAWGLYLLRDQLQDIRYLNKLRNARSDENGEPLIPGFTSHSLVRITQLSDEVLDRMETATQSQWDRYVQRARGQAIWKAQRPDGGWGQESSMASDAYATSQALIMLAQVDYGDLPQSSAWQRAIPVRGSLFVEDAAGRWILARGHARDADSSLFRQRRSLWQGPIHLDHGDELGCRGLGQQSHLWSRALGVQSIHATSATFLRQNSDDRVGWVL